MTGTATFTIELSAVVMNTAIGRTASVVPLYPILRVCDPSFSTSWTLAEACSDAPRTEITSTTGSRRGVADRARQALSELVRLRQTGFIGSSCNGQVPTRRPRREVRLRGTVPDGKRRSH
jgi:hypothetical protein